LTGKTDLRAFNNRSLIAFIGGISIGLFYISNRSKGESRQDDIPLEGRGVEPQVLNGRWMKCVADLDLGALIRG
jgi:hypothetical protein